jgi:hypothetical protein
MTRKKTVAVVTLADRDEAAAVAESLPATAAIALDDIAGAIREGLLAFSCSAGLLVIQQLMAEEMTAKVGPRGRHDPERVATRNGTAPGSVVLGGRTVPVDRPRATLAGGGELALDSYAVFSATDLIGQLAMERMLAGGGELALDSYAVFSATDLIGQLAMERMLAGVATRRHGDVAEPIGAELPSRCAHRCGPTPDVRRVSVR